ncbi:MAG: hypothetical protein ACTSVV_03510 [Promethearchaeota archaeon]
MKCKYNATCTYYEKTSRTCQKLGGDHCGKKREMDYKSSKQFKSKKSSPLIRPVIHA